MTTRKKSATVAVEIDRGSKERHQSGDHTIVWSSLPAPYTIHMPVSRYETVPGSAPTGSHVDAKATIHPGRNKIDSEVWDWAKQKPSVQKRLDMRAFVVAAKAADEPADVTTKLTGMLEGNPLDKTTVLNTLAERSGDPAQTLQERLKQQGFSTIDENSALELGSPIVAGG